MSDARSYAEQRLTDLVDNPDALGAVLCHPDGRRAVMTDVRDVLADVDRHRKAVERLRGTLQTTALRLQIVLDDAAALRAERSDLARERDQLSLRLASTIHSAADVAYRIADQLAQNDHRDASNFVLFEMDLGAAAAQAAWTTFTGDALEALAFAGLGTVASIEFRGGRITGRLASHGWRTPAPGEPVAAALVDMTIAVPDDAGESPAGIVAAPQLLDESEQE